MSNAFSPGVTPPEGNDKPSMWFLFQGYRLLINRDEHGAQIPRLTLPEEVGLITVRRQYLGLLDQGDHATHCFCGEIGEGITPPAGFGFENLRPLYTLLDEQAFWLAGRAVQIVDWDRTNQFCGRCGHTTIDDDKDRCKVCPNCGLTSYPRLAPAVIVRVQRWGSGGLEILLARAQRFPTSMFSVLAGFVEPGETLEECVRREISEEVGIQVKNISYFGSQPWPFPHSLMIAFTADYDDGELTIDPLELVEAGWFSPEAMPTIPPPPSIASRLIMTWLDSTRRV